MMLVPSRAPLPRGKIWLQLTRVRTPAVHDVCLSTSRAAMAKDVKITAVCAVARRGEAENSETAANQNPKLARVETGRCAR